MTDLVHYRGAQYRRDELPAGANPAEVTPLDEWFAANKQHKAILAPTRAQRIADAAAPPARPAKAQGKGRAVAPAAEPDDEGDGD